MRAPAGTVFLSAELAQRIVDTLDPALEANLNLMDAGGTIVASRDASRIGTRHPAAREAAASGEAVLVRPGRERTGERAGANLPLVHRGQVIGVVGVTGPPEEARRIAMLLVHTIGLLLEREFEFEGESRRDAEDRELLSRLVYGAKPEDAIALLERRRPGVAWVLRAVVPGVPPAAVPGASGVDAASAVPRADAPDAVPAVDAAAARRLRSGTATPVVAAMLRGVLWCASAGEPDDEARIRLILAELAPGARVVRTEPCASPAELVREAGHLVTLTTRRGVLAAASESGELPVARARLALAAAALPEAMLLALAEPLTALGPGERATLEQFLRSGSAVAAARAGFTHRNTVMQRLERVARRTGFDAHLPEQAATLALAFVADRELADRGRSAHPPAS
ncbi:CdaR family transcriptional regulator [Agromyces archimandritae]|uniref:Helix-turn-helix domain-containing protein n=1 Tax=Agromyces archimandritae TaxID=2781962 RepID=A0A975IPL4_9MICO|nr:sugar diacid recognition domain-containing protein [Agromyces archimandritae]QTX04131.1 helix-turn-helix domain-containing protein [Agromyces archimandritae]